MLTLIVSAIVIVRSSLEEETRLWSQHGAVPVAFCLHVTLLLALNSWMRKLCAASGKWEHFPGRNRKPLRGWPPARIWPVAQTQGHLAAVTKFSRLLVSGLFAFVTVSRLSLGLPWVTHQWVRPRLGPVRLRWACHIEAVMWEKQTAFISPWYGAVAGLPHFQLVSGDVSANSPSAGQQLWLLWQWGISRGNSHGRNRPVPITRVCLLQVPAEGCFSFYQP